MLTMTRVWYAVRHAGNPHIYPEYLIPFRMSLEECREAIDMQRKATGYPIEGIIVRIEEKTVRCANGDFANRETKEVAIERYPKEE